MSCRGIHLCYRFGSCRPKGAARIQALSMYKLPRLCNGVISPETVSIRHPNADPNLDSKPMSAQRLRLSSALCTSATCMAIDLGDEAPSVHISQRFSPRFGMDSPVATSYSIPRRDCTDGVMGMPGHINFGMTVSQAPVSAVSSTSCHSSSGPTAHKLALVVGASSKIDKDR